jgi:hypothetical protein
MVERLGGLPDQSFPATASPVLHLGQFQCAGPPGNKTAYPQGVGQRRTLAGASSNDETVPNESSCLLEEAGMDQVQEWLEELAGPCSASRREILAEDLSLALEGFMGIESEMLVPVLLDLADSAPGTAAF